MNKNWTVREEQYLIDNAGKKPAREMQLELKRSYKSIQAKAKKLGLSLRCPTWNLVWCVECACWRTYVNERTGRCKVCQTRENLRAEEERCAQVMQQMTPEQLTIYQDSEAKRAGTKKIPPMPKKLYTDSVNRYERVANEHKYCIAMEKWTLSKLTRQYNACRTRLKRMRQAINKNDEKNEN